MERLSPNYTEKVSRYLESSGGQNGQGGISVEPVEEDSDSGDSLFITQKPVPVPVRSARSHPNLRSDTTPLRGLDEHEDGFSSSSSFEGRIKIPGTQKKKRTKKINLPDYSFPFLTGRRCGRRRRGTQEQNTSLHNAGIVGFFKSVRELWEARKKGEDVEASLPTVDADGEDISPLSEEEEERSEDEDIKVVERKVFAVPIKIKNQQTWGNHLKQKNIRKAAGARQEHSQEKQSKASNERQAEANTSRIIEEEDEVSNIESLQQPETLRTDGLQEGGQEERDTPHLQQKIRCTMQEVHENLESDPGVEDSASSHAEKGVKDNEKKRKSIEEDEEQPQSSVVSKPLSEKAKSKTKKKKRKKGEEIIRAEERGEEEEKSTAASQEMVTSHFIKRKKLLSFSDEATREEGEGASSFVALDEHVEKSPKERKKRTRTDSVDLDNSLDLVENESVENTDDTQKKADDDQMVTKKKKKKSKKSESFSENQSELDFAGSDDSVSVQERKESPSFLSADAESSQSVETSVDGAGQPRDPAGHFETESAEMNRNEEESVDEVRKKKKKKKRKKREMLETQDRVDKDQEQEFGEPNTTCQSASPEKTEPELKRKRKLSGSDTESLRAVESLESAAEAGLPPTDEAVVVKRKKKKKKKSKDETCHVIQESLSAGPGDLDQKMLTKPCH